MTTYADVKERVQDTLKAICLTDDVALTVVDYSLPSYEERMFVFNVDKDLVDHHLVAHGSGSGSPTDISKAVFFSNVPNSLCSCLGVFKTDGRYVGKHGQSLRIRGMSPTNSNAEMRDIVVHGSYYVNDHLASIHRIGRSWGCLAVDMTVIGDVMDEVEGGLIVSIYK
jgi:hypothetical protein